MPERAAVTEPLAFTLRSVDERFVIASEVEVALVMSADVAPKAVVVAFVKNEFVASMFVVLSNVVVPLTKEKLVPESAVVEALVIVA